MTDIQWQQVQELFEQVVELEPDKHAAFLAKACSDDAELRSEVESLLDHDRQASDGFMTPLRPGSGVKSSVEPDDPNSRIGTKIGSFTIKSVLASGGMGTVYEAQQEQPRRIVALKVMRRNIASRSALRRFQFESQILGRLRHENVAQVYDAGMHSEASGSVPYFAMEYVPDAQTVTEYAEEQGLGTRERLLLFSKICDAIHHGHQRGIIHRDLKPANILVGLSRVPKVIDFGVARSTDSDLSVTTQHTRVGQIVGTMQYMSPEQCDADPQELDTRSDVYSLGIVLYELLTGELPYDASGSTIYQAARMVKEEEPRKLSSINPKLRGDVETIVLKALEKDRDRRYASADELAADLRRCIASEPILARRPSAVYQLRMFSKRHKAIAGAIASVLIVLVVAVVLISYFALDAFLQSEKRKDVEAELESKEKEVKLVRYTTNTRGAAVALLGDDVATARELLGIAKQDLPMWEWRHLHGRLDQSAEDLPPMAALVRNFAVDHGGTRVAFSSYREPVGIINVESQEQAHIDLDTTGKIVAWSGDGRFLATLGLVETGEQVKQNVGAIRVWDVESEQLIGEWCVDNGDNGGLAFHPRENILVSGSATGDIRVWDWDNSEQYRSVWPKQAEPEACVRAHDEYPGILVFSPEGNFLASAVKPGAGGCDYNVCLWDFRDITDGRITKDDRITKLAVLHGHTDHVSSIAFGPEGDLIASGSIDGRVFVSDVRQIVQRVEEEQARTEEALDWCEPREVLQGHDEGVTAVAFGSTNERLFSGSHDRTIGVWKLQQVPEDCTSDFGRPFSGELFRKLRGHRHTVMGLSILPNGRLLSGDKQGELKLWDPEREEVTKLPEHGTTVMCTAFSPDGSFIISGDGDGFVRVWDADTQRFLHEDKLEYVRDTVCWIQDNKCLLAVVTGNRARKPPGRVLLYGLTAHGVLQEIGSHPPSPESYHGYLCATLSNNRQRLAVGDSKGVVHVWDVSQSSLDAKMGELHVHKGPVNGLAFLDNEGRWLVSASGNRDPLDEAREDFSILLSNVDEPRTLPLDQEGMRPEDGTRALAINSTCSLLATVSVDKAVCLWEVQLQDGKPRIGEPRPLTGHTDAVHSVAFHPTEPRLATGSADRTIRIWDTDNAMLVATLRGPVGTILGLSFDPKGETLAAASGGYKGRDNVVWLWDAKAPKTIEVSDEARSTPPIEQVPQGSLESAAPEQPSP